MRPKRRFGSAEMPFRLRCFCNGPLIVKLKVYPTAGFVLLGAESAHASVNSLDDLVAMAASHVTEPVNIVAQSMGGVVAIRLALMFPDLVRRLVLAVTSGGVPVADLGGSDWRGDYFAAFPNAAAWIATSVPDLSEAMQSIKAPTLLLWGNADPISPVAVGDRLASLIPDARTGEPGCLKTDAAHYPLS